MPLPDISQPTLYAGAFFKGRPAELLADGVAELERRSDDTAVDGVKAITAASPFVSSASFSSQTEISSKMRLTAPTLYLGAQYRFVGRFIYRVSDATTDFLFRVWKGTVGGVEVGADVVPRGGNTSSNRFCWDIPWTCDADGAGVTFQFSLLRASGSGTISIDNVIASSNVFSSQLTYAGLAANWRSVA